MPGSFGFSARSKVSSSLASLYLCSRRSASARWNLTIEDDYTDCEEPVNAWALSGTDQASLVAVKPKVAEARWTKPRDGDPSPDVPCCPCRAVHCGELAGTKDSRHQGMEWRSARAGVPNSRLQIVEWRLRRLVYFSGYKTPGRFSGLSACGLGR